MSNELPDRLVDRKERRRIIPYSDPHYLRLEKEGRVPARIVIGRNRVAWSLRELTEWVERRKSERDGAVRNHVEGTGNATGTVRA